MVRKPSLSRPMADSMRPTTKVICTAIRLYRACARTWASPDGLFGSVMSRDSGMALCSPSFMRRDTMATGPTASCLELPKIA